MLDAPTRAPLAPPETVATPGSRASLVLASGLATTLAALGTVYLANRSGVNLMGWYAALILPAGAILVGLLAASGYGLAAWLAGVKMTGLLCALVAALLGASYLAAQYLEFRLLYPDGALGRDGAPLGFWTYFDHLTRSFAWERDGRPGSSLGGWGYAVRALELAGFVGGGVAVPTILRAAPYCDACRRYKRSHMVACLPAGILERVGSSLRGVSEGRRADAESAAAAGLQAIFAAAAAGDLAELAREIAERGPLSGRKQAQQLTGHVDVNLVHCARCGDGSLVGLLRVRRRQSLDTTRLGEQALTKELVAVLRGTRDPRSS